jgi:surface antigen
MKLFILAAALLATACAATPPHLSYMLTDTDQERLDVARFYAFHGTQSSKSIWSNVRTGNGGTVRALAEFRDPQTDQRCRKLVEDTRSTEGRRDMRVVTACALPDGNLAVTFSPDAEG